MKKMSKRLIVALLVGAVMVQGLSAYDFNWGAWGRAGWAPLVVQGGADPNGTKASDTTNFLGVGSGPAWDSLGAAIGFETNAANAANTLGFQLKLRVDSNNTNKAFWYPNDNAANAWAKPFGDILTIRVGMYEVDDLRGKIGGANENLVTGGLVSDEDAIMPRFRASNVGAHFKIVPIENLQIHVTLGANTNYGGDFTQFEDGFVAVWSTGQYGIGYTIPDIGFARLQFLGGKYGKNYSNSGTAASIFPDYTKDYNLIQLAFQLTAVQNLNLDFGVGIPLVISNLEKEPYTGSTKGYIGYSSPLGPFVDKDDTYQAPINIALAARYNLTDLGLGILFRTDVKLMEKATIAKIDTEGGLSLAFLIEPSYKIGDVGTIFADIALRTVGDKKVDGNESKDGKTDLGLGVSFHRNMGGGGNFTIGVSSFIPVAGEGYDGDLNAATKAKAFKIAVPMTITYSLY